MHHLWDSHRGRCRYKRNVFTTQTGCILVLGFGCRGRRRRRLALASVAKDMALFIPFAMLCYAVLRHGHRHYSTYYWLCCREKRIDGLCFVHPAEHDKSKLDFVAIIVVEMAIYASIPFPFFLFF